ncbi:RNA polymerase sigma factor [Plantactinospora sp. WMMB334]|uniref:RNA polymerase sigma factor n=1 Tax=Plantactinospora sp. WMMB334 TaxID=3404119 RepID=UPI003B95150C
MTRVTLQGTTVEAGTAAWDAAARHFAAWRGGDRTGLDRLVRLMTPTLWHLARAHSLDRRAAEDAVQATWLALVRNAESVRDPQAIWRWTTTTVRREAWRLARTHRQEDMAEPSTLDELVASVPGPEAQVLADDAVRSLWQQVARLPERCRRLLRAIAFDNRPDYATLSTELAIPVGSIGPTRSRCLEKLRRALGEDPRRSER